MHGEDKERYSISKEENGNTKKVTVKHKFEDLVVFEG
jgi:hypothetical protein